MGMSPAPAVCWKCKNYLGNKIIDIPKEEGEDVFYCKAFPDKIPEEIISGEHDHQRPFDGDHGISFEGVPDNMINVGGKVVKFV